MMHSAPFANHRSRLILYFVRFEADSVMSVHATSLICIALRNETLKTPRRRGANTTQQHRRHQTSIAPPIVPIVNLPSASTVRSLAALIVFAWDALAQAETQLPVSHLATKHRKTPQTTQHHRRDRSHLRDSSNREPSVHFKSTEYARSQRSWFALETRWTKLSHRGRTRNLLIPAEMAVVTASVASAIADC